MRFNFTYGGFDIDTMPGQPQVALCHSFFVRPGYRGLGCGKELKKDQAEELKKLGYDLAIATVAGDNERMKRIMETSGWKLKEGFLNTRAGGHTHVYAFVVADWKPEPRE